MTTALVTGDEVYYERQAAVMTLRFQGDDPTTISKKLSLPRKDVLKYIEDFTRSAIGEQIFKDRLEEMIVTSDAHYTRLIKEQWKTIEEVNSNAGPSPQMLAQKSTAVKIIADLESKRIEIYQHAAMLGAEMGDEVARMEQEVEELMQILNQELCKSCLAKLRSRVQARKNEVIINVP